MPGYVALAGTHDETIQILYLRHRFQIQLRGQESGTALILLHGGAAAAELHVAAHDLAVSVLTIAIAFQQALIARDGLLKKPLHDQNLA